ncbi:hypothetical protein BDV95DRAFT_602946 [Massariosphaeria phaeospora]|uniref:SAP domain-containing protein n=1 Tax=Massariosphaeria phaeospora TaxID=100035 RepID=A0A7C8IBR4_9PLEO|nr:hypothetical protein BDV95DRAFT_602946 [Massariosphaeria phaeospora]
MTDYAGYTDAEINTLLETFNLPTGGGRRKMLARLIKKGDKDEPEALVIEALGKAAADVKNTADTAGELVVDGTGPVKKKRKNKHNNRKKGQKKASENATANGEAEQDIDSKHPLDQKTESEASTDHSETSETAMPSTAVQEPDDLPDNLKDKSGDGVGEGEVGMRDNDTYGATLVVLVALLVGCCWFVSHNYTGKDLKELGLQTLEMIKHPVQATKEAIWGKPHNKTVAVSFAERAREFGQIALKKVRE